MPVRPVKPNPFEKFPDVITFTYKGPPGEIVTVTGSFNGWDPFMYELKEKSEGVYTLALPLMPGKYQYVFFCKGQRIVDSFNPNRSYARDGNAASVIVVP
jgi:1,4-alpha-glucan branching enzyme